MTVLGTTEFDHLLGDSTPERVSGVATILAGEGDGGGNLFRGSILGKVHDGSATGAAVGGNTGATTIGSITKGANVKPGVYRATCISVAANSGRFEVVDPDGNVIGVAVVGTAFTHPQINFTLTDAGTDSALGDAYTVTVAAGSDKMRLVDSANVDGSAVPYCILAEDIVLASMTDYIGAAIYKTGCFDSSAMTVGGSDTVAQYKDALERRQIFITTNLPA